MASQSLETPSTVQRWWRWTVVILIGVLGIKLAFKMPLWLPPPSFASTPLIYMVLALLWIPAGIILHPDRNLKKRWVARLLVIALTLGWIATWAAPNAYVLFTDAFWGHKCDSEALPDGQIRYNCTLKNYSADKFDFVGPQNGMFVQLVESDSTN